MAQNFSVSNTAERDIDLLLLEEFVASNIFTRWFVSQIGDLDLGNQPIENARRSVTTSCGESDLEIYLALASGEFHYLLIENKIGAAFQPRQAERYRLRGEHYVDQGDCSGFKTVLVAPKSYLDSRAGAQDFDASICYESICAWLQNAEGNKRRMEFKLALLRSAIEKSTLGYQPIADDAVTDFWQAYWKLAMEIAPELAMDSPGTKPSGAGFVWFRPPVLPDGVCIVHKLPYGQVDLQFPGMGPDLHTMHRQFGNAMKSGMQIARASKSGAIRLVVPQLDTSSAFPAQSEAVAEGIRAAKVLLDWYTQLSEGPNENSS